MKEHNYTNISTYLLTLSTGNLQACTTLHKQWTDWVKEHTHPISPPIKLEDIPFYSPLYQHSYKNLFKDIVNKKNIFKLDFSNITRDYGFWEKSEEVQLNKPYFKLSDSEYQICLIHYGKNKQVSSSLKVIESIINNIKRWLPRNMYYLGINNGDYTNMFIYITEEEYRNRQLEDNMLTRVVQTRNMFDTLKTGRIKADIEGVLITNEEQLSKGTWIYGNNLWKDMKEVKIG